MKKNTQPLGFVNSFLPYFSPRCAKNLSNVNPVDTRGIEIKGSKLQKTVGTNSNSMGSMIVS
jgi:hypothetical protein